MEVEPGVFVPEQTLAASRPAAREPDHVLGLDLGQAADYTALAVLERSWRRDPAGRSVSHFAVRHLRRWPLGTSYPQIVADVDRLARTPPLSNPLLAADQTGVGTAVVDLFRQARLPLRLRPVLITGGHETVSLGFGYHVPKKELVSVLQVLFQQRRIKVAPLPECETLVKELLSFKVKVTVADHETFEAWRERDHDDLVLAVALAAWLGEEEGGPLIVGPPVPNPALPRAWDCEPFTPPDGDDRPGGERRRLYGRQ